MQDIQKINFQMHTPCNELNGFVQAFWFTENNDNTEDLSFKILNDCGSTLVLNYGDEIIYEQNKNSLNTRKGCSTMGPSKELLTMIFKGQVKSIGIHFYPATAHHFFNCSMDKLSNQLLITHEDHFTGSAELYERIKGLFKVNTEQNEIIKALEEHLITLLKESKTKPQSALINILKAIHMNHEITLEELSSKFNISPRDIQRLFKTYVGVSPKAYIRLTKVRYVKELIANDEFESLTQLSMDSGYFDQAHFIRDFKAFMDETPKKYHKLKKGNDF